MRNEGSPFNQSATSSSVLRVLKGILRSHFPTQVHAQDDVLMEKETPKSYNLSSNEISNVKSFQSGLIELTKASFHLRVFPFMYFSLAIASTMIQSFDKKQE